MDDAGLRSYLHNLRSNVSASLTDAALSTTASVPAVPAASAAAAAAAYSDTGLADIGVVHCSVRTSIVTGTVRTSTQHGSVSTAREQRVGSEGLDEGLLAGQPQAPAVGGLLTGTAEASLVFSHGSDWEGARDWTEKFRGAVTID